MSSKSDSPPEPPKPRRRWKRWVFGALIVFAAFLLWANGPGIRWTVKKVLSDQLKTQELAGTFDVKGTALKGLAIHNLSLTGKSKVQNVQSNLIKIDWSLSSLREKQIHAITLKKLHVVIDPKAPDPPQKDGEDESDDSQKKPLSETLDLVRNFLQPTEINATDLKVVIKETATVSLGSLTHSPNAPDYLIKNVHTVDHLDRPIHNRASTVTWTADGFDLDRLGLLPNLTLRDVAFHPEKKASAQIFIKESQLTFTSDLAQSHQLTLDSPELSIPAITELAGQKLKVDGSITKLQIDTSKGFVNIQARDLKWEEQELATASIEARTKDLLSPFDQPVEIKVALADQLDVTGTITPNKEPLDSQADLAFTLREPRLPIITGELTYDSREARLLASTLDKLLLNARYFVDSSNYQAEASSKLDDASKLDPALCGPLDFTLTAKGSVKEKSHSGTIKLNQLQLNQPKLADTTTEGLITYDWPKKVDIQNLKMTSPKGQITANLAWQDDLLTISQLDLIESGKKLLTATAKLPAPLDTKSIDDILNSNEPISLTLKSNLLSFERISSFAPIPKDLAGVIQADLALSGSFAKPALNGYATLDTFRSASQPELPPIDLTLNFKTKAQKLFFNTRATEPTGPLLNIDGDLPFLPRVWIEHKTNPNEIPVNLHVHTPNLDLRRLNNFPSLPEKLSGNLKTDLSLSGTLDKPTLNGFLNLEAFRISSQPDLSPLDLDLNFKTEKQELTLSAKTADANGPLLRIGGSLPFLPQVWMEQKTNPDDSPISLRISSPNLDLRRLEPLHLGESPSFPNQLSGILKADLSLAGTFAQPSLDGFLNLDGFQIATQPDLPPIDLDLNLKTENQKLLLTADANEPGGPLINIAGNLPFLPRPWIERKTNPNDSPINLRASSPNFNLRRVQPFAPMVKKIDGNLELDLRVSGTISEPRYSGSTKIRIAEMRIAESPISTFRNAKLDATFLEDTITLKSNNLSASGGKAQVSGTIDIGGKEPVFDIHLDGSHVLLHRTPDYTFRGHTDLDLRGPYSAAAIFGSVKITESLIYKDVEILPFGVPRTTEIPTPNIPSFSKKRTLKPTTKPKKGIMDCRLNIDVTTDDPILIRGNLARGEVSGTAKVTGTIRDPKTSGTLIAKDLSADLPFSDLNVQSGVITLRPDSLTNPLISLRGSSVVGQYTVQVYVTGPVQNPTLILTSDPPLPESEIMLLLATGSASEQLEDRQVASQKALQYLLEGLRRRNRDKDKSLFQRLLKNSDQIELSLGDTNQFSGRKFSSATLEIDDQWDFTTQIDELGQTRALVVFSLRLK